PRAFALIAAFTLVALVTDPAQRAARLLSSLAAATYTYDFFADARPMTGLGHMWSLALEEQFYLLWPPLLLVCLRGGKIRLAVGAIVALIILMTAWRVGFVIAGSSFSHISYGPERADSI